MFESGGWPALSFFLVEKKILKVLRLKSKMSGVMALPLFSNFLE